MANADTLVNSIYPIEYFTLGGVTPIDYPDGFWWSSRQRYASVDSNGSYAAVSAGGSQTTEYLEIDLGRLRQINYINFDVLRVPIDITIEYDAVSSSTRNPLPLWLPVKPLVGLPFDSSIFFDGTNRSMWFNGDFHFTDALGNIVQAEHLRIGFTRRDESWPLSTSVPFPWPVFVKHLRIARYVSKLEESIGPLLAKESFTPVEYALPIVTDHTRDARQQFVYPENAPRGDIMPRITGFSILVKLSASVDPEDVQFVWSIWDITNNAQLLQGTSNNAQTPGTAWFDVYFDPKDYIAGALNTIYELRVASYTPDACDTVYTSSPEELSSQTIPGTLGFTHGSTNVTTTTDTRSVVKMGSFIVNAADLSTVYLVNGVTSTTITLNVVYGGTSDGAASGYVLYPFSSWNGSSYAPDATKYLVSRIWSDTGDEGKDILGNAYRYGARLQKATSVTDPTKPGWMSQPVPTPEAVECLYFDVRGFDNITMLNTLAQLDSMEIAARTPGVQMNIYYTQQGLQGEVPKSVEDWDLLLWSPVAHKSFTLRRKEVINYPYPINASFIKLEFTGLNPLPFNLPVFPQLPPREYKVFPDWVKSQFVDVDTSVPVQKSVTIEDQVLARLTDPVLEFEHTDRNLISELALGLTNAEASVNDSIDTDTSAQIDSATGKQVFIGDTNQYGQGYISSVTQDTILGKVITGRFNPNLILDPLEQPAGQSLTNTLPIVSAPEGRLDAAYQALARTHLRFNKACRHEYSINQAYFNKKAYFVGIRHVRFLRSDFTVTRDDPIVVESFWDDAALASNTWGDDLVTSVADGQTVYVSYNAAGADFVDEQVTMNTFIMTQLLGLGGPATNVRVFSAPLEAGIRYFQNTDYELAYSSVNGVRASLIGRAPLTARLIAPQQTINYQDAGTVVGVGVIPQPPTNDSGTVIGVGIPSTTNEGIDDPVYASGEYGAVGGTYADLRGKFVDSATVVGVGVPSGVTFVESTDAGTVIGVGVPSCVDTKTP